jgi:hypothetical protein
MSFNVFISYSTRDLAVVTALRQNLDAAGAAAYVAEYSTSPGQSLSQEIRHAIEGCHLFLLVWSTNAQSSEWVPQEIGVATGLRKPIMPVVLHAGLRLPAFLSDLKFLELYKNPEGAVAWLQTFVAARVQHQKQSEAWALIGIVGAILLGLSTRKD